MSKHKSKKKNQKAFPSIVRLGGDNIDWNRIPQKLMLSVKTDKLPRLRRIHQSISEAANIVMPPIEVVPSGWVTSDNSGMIYGRCKLLLDDDSYLFGVQIPAATLFFVDDILLRRILVHEFTHCFWYYEQIMLGLARGEMVLDNSPAQFTEKDVAKMSEDDIDALMRADPFDWFSDQDAVQFLDYDHDTLDPSTLEFHTNWVDKGLPTEIPDLKIDFHEKLGIPDDVIKHIHDLLGDEVVGVNPVIRLLND